MCPVCSSELPSLVLCDNPLQHTTSHLQTNGNPPDHADHTPAACFWLLLWPATHHIQTGDGSCTRGAAAKQRKLLGSLRRCNGPFYPPDPQTLPACLCPSLPPSINPSIHPSTHSSMHPASHPPIRPSALLPSFPLTPFLPSLLPSRQLPPSSSMPTSPSPRISPHSRAPSLQLPGRAKGNKPPVAPSADGQEKCDWVDRQCEQSGRQTGRRAGQGRPVQGMAWEEGGR